MDDLRISPEVEAPRPEIPAIAVEVRQGRASDRDAIATFLERAYRRRAKYKGAARWEWQFVSNPFSHQPTGLVPVWIALDGDQVVGQIAVQEAILQVGDETLDAGWILDVMILPSHRGMGIGHRLYEAVAADAPVLVTLTMADATRRMAERLSAVTLDHVHQLTRWVRLDSQTIRRYLMVRTATHPRARVAVRLGCDVGQLHRLLPLVVNPVLWARDRVRPSPGVSDSTRIAEVTRFGHNMDELWERTRRDYPVIFPRDARFLNWRFVDSPQPRYRCFVAEREGRTVGYVVLRHAESVELPEGHIVDLYAARDDRQTIEDLVAHSISFFGSDVAALDAAASMAEFETVLRRHGFVRTRTHRPTCVCQDDGLRRRIADLSGGWFFSKGDHDWDQIHDVEALAEEPD
ncbi:MAG: GNAT family N-acetyltransferase [Solirubrobacterales bacterium]|nr:GNAT family N-acetyltransferase [Solirubrobacterales bacterium]